MDPMATGSYNRTENPSTRRSCALLHSHAQVDSGKEESRPNSGMVRAAEESVHHLLTTRLGRVPRIGVGRDVNSVDAVEDLRVVTGQHPAPLGRIVAMHNTQIDADRFHARLLAPYPELQIIGGVFGVGQVIGIEDQGAAFDIEHTTKSFLRGTVALRVVDVHDVKVTRRNHLSPDSFTEFNSRERSSCA